MSDAMFIEENYELVDIETIDVVEDSREVYDLEVEEDHTYVLANDIISHNSRAKAGKSMFKEMTRFCGKNRIPFIYTNHIYEKPGANAFLPSTKVQSGGNQPTYMSTAVIFMAKKKERDEKDKKKILGNILKMKSEKNRLCPEGEIAEMFLSFKTGPNSHYGILADAVKAGLVDEINTKNYFIKHLDKKLRINDIYGKYKKDVFTKEFLDKLDEFCVNEYSYSSSSMSDDLIDAIDVSDGDMEETDD